MTEITWEYIQAQIRTGRKYVMVFLVEGPKRDQPKEEAERIQREHQKHLFTLRQRGKLVVNGPLLDHPRIRGVSIYAVTDKGEAMALAAEDPAVKAGRLAVEAWEYFSLPGSSLPA
jgi:uncharacterized protein